MQALLADCDQKFAKQILEHWTVDDVPLTVVTSPAETLASARRGGFDVIFLAHEYLTINQLDLMSLFKEYSPHAEIFILFEQVNPRVQEAVMNRGASATFQKPLSAETLANSTRRASLRVQNRESHRLLEEHVLDELLGNTPAMRKILKTIHKVAPTNSTILITGESGTGKEFISNIIHRLSKRADGPFIAVNCGAIPDNIVESELFGVKKGAFTGATHDKPGLFEEANGGTLFLDELGELPHATQVKLLRFLDKREIRRLGENENRIVDVRVIAATNKDLSIAMTQKEFREDLFYRLNTFQLHLPPLRERKETIAALVKFFVLRFSQENQKEIESIENQAQMALTRYNYPGNVRELANIIEHAVVLSENRTIVLDDLPEKVHFHEQPLSLADPRNIIEPNTQNSDSKVQENSNQFMSLADVEKIHISLALKFFKNNQTETSKALGISRSTLWRKIQEHNIQHFDSDRL